VLPIAVNFSAGVRVEVDEPAPAEADELSDADELDEPSPEDEDEASEDEASEDEVVVVEELSPLLSLAVCDAVSQAARKNVTANSAIRR
jgi:hypothetical protein